MKLPDDFVKHLADIGLDPSVYEHKPEKCIRVNTLKPEMQLKNPVPWCPECFCDNAPKEMIDRGIAYVQDAASCIPVLALDPKPGELILDMCAAPGTKTLHMAARMHNKGKIVANDVNSKRLMRLEANLKRYGATNCEIVCADARRLKWKEKFDKILLDAPCSGEGIAGKIRKTAKLWSEKRVTRMAKAQKKMITNALKLLKADGTLVYSTCTFEKEENEDVVQHAIDSGATIENISIKGLNYTSGFGVKDCIRVYPHHNNTNGFFVAKLRLA